MIQVMPLSSPTWSGISRLYDQPLYDSQKIDSGYISFFTQRNPNLLSNFYGNGCLLSTQGYTIRRVALFASGNTRPNDFYKVLKNATFKLQKVTTTSLDIPATQIAWASIKEINNLLYSIRKLPQAQQELILRNLKVADGYKLELPIEINPQESFRVLLEVPAYSEVKREVVATCLFGGIERRGLY